MNLRCEFSCWRDNENSEFVLLELGSSTDESFEDGNHEGEGFARSGDGLQSMHE